MIYSFIIPVYNRPDEIEELLESLSQQTYQNDFEVVVVEDGSSLSCENVVNKYRDLLSVSYYYKENSGPGASRNYGMQKAKGSYFIILDSDCLLPDSYLQKVDECLKNDYVDCFGGPDNAAASFSDIQKAINFAMTSFITTGGIRGGSEQIGKFQPRSFNMGLSKKAFEATQGFGKIHPGEDPDLVIRLWKMGYETRLFEPAYVYHKRRIDWQKFYRQVNKFGKARPILNQRYPEYSKITFWFPTLFCLFFILAVSSAVLGNFYMGALFVLYFIVLYISALLRTKDFKIAAYAIIATLIQFYGYGSGFLKSNFKLFVLNQKAEEAMPEMFFK
ncbi:glycosyltransferase [Myroides ceti]|uniref:Glycosyltransferase n=1 Tax=Paenimyroides ceti TaxID=395087 RepID=A0ABT8CTK0_9FLAO|nr:glycosyltransferase [Paenimyroides ceti]MDN3707504.1 glycosyltransferase [Paenimyroides ceti]